MEYDTIFAAARRAGNELALVDAGRLSRTVAKAAALLRENAGKVLAANALDLEAMDADSPMRDRLRLTADRIASIAASRDFMPRSMLTCAASTTTIASSTTSPIANTSPNSEMMLIEKPNSGKKMNVPMSETGMATSGMSVARQS